MKINLSALTQSNGAWSRDIDRESAAAGFALYGLPNGPGSDSFRVKARAVTRQLILSVLAIMLAIGAAFAQGTLTSGGKRWSAFQSYDSTKPPPLALPEAYQLAIARVGEATNRFHCVAASCLEMTNNGFTGWTFWFSNTNAQRARVDVFFDKEVHVGITNNAILRAKPAQ